jgi:pilus assembly protein CpaE
MKIKIVTPDSANAQAWTDALRAEGGFDVKTVVSALREANVVINGSRPDLVLVQTSTPQDFEALEQLAAAHPEVDHVLVSSTLEPEILMRAMRAGVREVLRTPCEPAAVVAAAVAAKGRLMRKRPSQPPPAVGPAGQVLTLVSCKGGSGTTFVAANLAHLLTQAGRRRVALIDLNLQFGDAALFVSDGRGNSHVADVARHIDRLDADLLRSSMREVTPGLWVLAAPDDPAQGVDVTREHVRQIVELAREMHDHVVIDAGRALSPVTLQALDMADRIYPVLQLTLPFLRDGRRLREVFQSLDYPEDKIQWIVNRHQKDGEFSTDDLKKALGVRVIITLPNHHEAVASSVNQGVPVGQVAPSSSVTRALQDLARGLLPAAPPRTTGNRWLAGLFGTATS